MNTEEEPLIHTINGNVPVSSLTYQVAWDVRDDSIRFHERYLDSDGKIVKESAHVHVRQGAVARVLASDLN